MIKIKPFIQEINCKKIQIMIEEKGFGHRALMLFAGIRDVIVFNSNGGDFSFEADMTTWIRLLPMRYFEADFLRMCKKLHDIGKIKFELSQRLVRISLV